MNEQMNSDSNTELQAKMDVLKEKEQTLQDKTDAMMSILEEMEQARVRAEENEAKFRAIFEGANDGILLVNYETLRMFIVNQRFAEMTGYTQEELTQMTISDIHPSDQWSWIQEEFRKAASGTVHHMAQVPFRRKDGSRFIADISGFVIVLGGKQYNAGIVRDITERLKAQEEIRQRESELSSIFRAAPIGIGVVVNRILTKANQRLCEIVGYTEEELIGQNARMLYPSQEDYDYVGREKYNQIREKGTGTVETRWLTKDGRILDMLLSSTPFDPLNLGKGVTFTALDITGRKRAEAELAERLKMEQLVSTISGGFINLPADKVDAEINHVLKRLVEGLGLDRAELMEANEDRSRLFLGSHFYYMNSPGLPPFGDIDREMPGAAQNIRNNKIVWYADIPHDLPPEDEDERQILTKIGARSVIVIPMFVGEKLMGALALLSRARKISFSRTLLNFLKLIAEILANALLRQRNERALEFTQFAVEHINESAFWVNSDGQFTYVNETACKMLGYSKEELLAMGVRGIDPIYNGATWSRHWKDLKQHGSLVFETQHKTKSGESISIEMMTNFVVFGGREFNCAFARDITDRKKAAQALQESQARYYTLFKSASDAIFLMKDDRFIECNPKTLELFRCTQEEILNHTPFDFSPSVQPDGIKSDEKGLQLIRSASAGQQQIFEWRHCRADKTEFDTEISLNRMELKSGIFLLAIVRDITERKQAEQAQEKLLKELRAKNEELESIVFIASHDLRSPLVNIEGFTGEVRKSSQELSRLIGQISCGKEIRQQINYLLEKDIPESIRFISAGTAKMDGLLSGLLRLSRIGTATIHIEPVQMNLLIQTVLGAMRFEIQRLGVEIRTENLPNCMGDAVLINQIFSNLIDNAIKYCKPDHPARIRITGIQQGDMVHYAVADDGIGIDPQHHGKIFEIFHQLNPSGSQGGQGLGLTIVRRILDRLDGRIWVESAPNAGSTFTVALPGVR